MHGLASTWKKPIHQDSTKSTTILVSLPGGSFRNRMMNVFYTIEKIDLPIGYAVETWLTGLIVYTRHPDNRIHEKAGFGHIHIVHT